MTEYNIQSNNALGRIPTENEEGLRALTAAVQHWVLAAPANYWTRALTAFENGAYLLGNHTTRFYYDSTYGLGVSASGQPIRSGDAGSVTPPVIENRLIRACEAFVSLITEVQPAPRVVPNSDLPEDEDAAALSQLVLELYYERPLDMPAKLREAGLIAATFEGVVAETTFAETGEQIEVPRISLRVEQDAVTGEEVPVPVEDGVDIVDRRDLSLNMWTPLHVQVDPGATTEDDITWIARSTFEDVDDVREKFEIGEGRTRKDGFFLEPGEEIPENRGLDHPLYWYSKLQDILPSPQAGAWATGGTPLTALGGLPNQTLFTVIDVKPNSTHPRGRTIICASGKVLYAGDARAWSPEYPWRWHPYSFFSWSKIPGRFFGMGLLTELVPLQKRINAIDYLVQKNREHMAIGQYWLPKHARIRPGSIQGLTGLQYEYNAVAGLPGPERVQNQPLPGDLLMERDQLTNAIDMISATGIRPDQIAPSAARAGVILDFMRSEKLRDKGPMLRAFERFVESISQHALIELQLNMREENEELTARIRRAAREYSNLSIQSFTGLSLRDHHSVKIDIATALRHTPEAASANAMQYLQYKRGEVTPAETGAILRANGLEKYMKNEQDASLARARRMISRITQGMVEAFQPIPGVEDESVVVPEFKKVILSDRFLDLDPEIQTILLQAHDYYEQALMQKLLQMQMQMAQAGVAPEPPAEPEAGPAAEEPEAAE